MELFNFFKDASTHAARNARAWPGNDQFQRLYGFGFLMTGDEALSEELALSAIQRAQHTRFNDVEAIDVAMLEALRSVMRIGVQFIYPIHFSPAAGEVKSASIHDLTRAVLQLPEAERLIYLLRHALAYSSRHIAAMYAHMGVQMTEAKVQALDYAALLRLRTFLAHDRSA